MCAIYKTAGTETHITNMKNPHVYIHICLQQPCAGDTKDTEIPGSCTFARVLTSSDAACGATGTGQCRHPPHTLISEVTTLTP